MLFFYFLLFFVLKSYILYIAIHARCHRARLFREITLVLQTWLPEQFSFEIEKHIIIIPLTYRHCSTELLYICIGRYRYYTIHLLIHYVEYCMKNMLCIYMHHMIYVGGGGHIIHNIHAFRHVLLQGVV